MNTCCVTKTWQELYREALFEIDNTKLTERIAEAEQAIAVRARALFAHPENASPERAALDTASHALSVLKFYSHAHTNKAKPPMIPVLQRKFQPPAYR